MTSYSESFVLASKVRAKLTKEAANPKSSLRSLVLQANMLDNIMDHISHEAEKRKASTAVKFSLPRKPSTTVNNGGASITEYEVDSDSDDDYYSDSDSDSDSYYYSSEEEDDDEGLEFVIETTQSASFKQLPSINLSLTTIEEESESSDLHDSLPELSRSTSLTDSESEDEMAECKTHLIEPLHHDKPSLFRSLPVLQVY